jgi:IclR family mhp operon transcriptional activator
LTAQVKALSAGFHDDVWVTRAAAPILHELGREVLWPVDLVTFENDAMIIRETTHAESPFSIDRGMAGTQLPVLQTSGGRAHLAFCPTDERDVILARLRQSGKPGDALAHDEKSFNASSPKRASSVTASEPTASIRTPPAFRCLSWSAIACSPALR